MLNKTQKCMAIVRLFVSTTGITAAPQLATNDGYTR